MQHVGITWAYSQPQVDLFSFLLPGKTEKIEGFLLLLLNGIDSMKGRTVTTRHAVARKRKNLQLKDVY